MTEQSFIKVSRQDDVLMIGFNRPEKRNTVKKSMMFKLREIFQNIKNNVGAAVIYSTGRHFCSGLDLARVKVQSVIDSSVRDFLRFARTLREMQRAAADHVLMEITGLCLLQKRLALS